MDVLTLGIAGVVFLIAAVIVLVLLFVFIKKITRFFLALLVNSVVGLIALGVLKLVGVSIPLSLPVLISIALFGLGALGTILVLLFFGVQLP